MAITRVIVTLPYFTALPEDVASNVFYFASVASPTNLDAAAIAVRLDNFYLAIDQLLSPVIATTGGTYRFYHMEDPAPRVPFITINMPTLTLGAQGLPEEVALCVSYYAAPASGQPAARRRGRIYLGPMAVATSSPGTSSTFSSPLGSARTTIANAAAVLADQSEPFQWAVYSTVDNIARQIVAGWIDHAWDSQRRRGRRSTGRNIWTGQA